MESDGLETEAGSEADATRSADRTILHLRRLVKQQVKADEEVAINVSTLRRRIDTVEEELEDSEEQSEGLRRELEECQEMWIAKYDRRRGRVQELSEQVEDFRLRNEELVRENKSQLLRIEALEKKDDEGSTVDDAVRNSDTAITLENNITELSGQIRSLEESLNEEVKCGEDRVKVVQDELEEERRLRVEREADMARLSSKYVSVPAISLLIFADCTVVS